MKQALIVEASPLGASSSSRKISQELEARLREEHPQARIVRRDLAQDPVPHLDGAALGGFAGKGEGARLSDELIEELLASDLLVIATPMWNFGIPSALKAWVDHVVRAGKTFSYAAGGPKGLVSGKKAVVIASSGGIYSDGGMKAYDFVTPYLKAVLGFIGITDVQVVRAEGLAIADLAEAGLTNARRAVAAAAL